MEKFKICPSCGERNEPSFFECMSCETDLTRVKITDEASEKIKKEKEEFLSQQIPEKEELTLFRFCDCGAENPSNARKCTECGEDISDILPTLPTNSTHLESFSSLFVSLDGLYTYEITEGTVTLGREGIMGEYLSEKSFVSRIHAKLEQHQGVITLENMSSTNFTYVNDEKITDVTVLQPGDEIGFGGRKIDGNYQENAAYFTLRSEQCT